MTPHSLDHTHIETTENTLQLRRTFDAPRERVWRAFTDSAQLEAWFVPAGMTAEVEANELEPGGSMTITWTDGDNRIVNAGQYIEVIENERLVSAEPIGSDELRLTYEFRDVDDGTEVTIIQEFPDQVPDGAGEGWAGMLDNLSAKLADDATGFDPSDFDMTIERTFDAPRDAVWNAWTEPNEVAAWWGPEHFTVPHCELDVRPGGVYQIHMEAPDGTIYPDEGIIKAVDEPERLVFVSQVFEDDDGNFQMEVEHTATFEDRGDRTGFRLESSVLSATPEMRMHLDGMEAGWTGSFDKLDEYLDGDVYER